MNAQTLPGIFMFVIFLFLFHVLVSIYLVFCSLGKMAALETSPEKGKIGIIGRFVYFTDLQELLNI